MLNKRKEKMDDRGKVLENVTVELKFMKKNQIYILEQCNIRN